jgi:hypothetical protein
MLMRSLFLLGREQDHRDDLAGAGAPARPHGHRRQASLLLVLPWWCEHHDPHFFLNLPDLLVYALPSPKGRSTAGQGSRPPFARPG